jgi:hypothetical protein
MHFLEKKFKDYNFPFENVWFNVHMKKLWTCIVMGFITWPYWDSYPWVSKEIASSM